MVLYRVVCLEESQRKFTRLRGATWGEREKVLRSERGGIGGRRQKCSQGEGGGGHGNRTAGEVNSKETFR